MIKFPLTNAEIGENVLSCQSGSVLVIDDPILHVSINFSFFLFKVQEKDKVSFLLKLMHAMTTSLEKSAFFFFFKRSDCEIFAPL